MSDSFLHFLDQSPTAFHAAKTISHSLMENDFEPITEQSKWQLQLNEKFFFLRDDSVVAAFILPKKKPVRNLIFASHLDSPCLKIKPSLLDKTYLPVDIYGAPMLYSWLGLDLAIAGRVVFLNEDQEREKELINLEDFPLIAPPLAIHLDREVNEKGLHLNKQDHLTPLLSLSEKNILTVIQELYPNKEILSFDLFLYPLQKASYVGLDLSMIASKKLDNLASAFSMQEAFIKQEPLEDTLLCALFFDHEEVGSQTDLGAQSAFFPDALYRICHNLQMSQEEYFQLKSSSFCFSLDVAHAYHAPFSTKYDPHFSPHLGKGPVLKYHAKQKYMSSSEIISVIKQIATKEHIPLQTLTPRNDIPSGSTVGPVLSSLMGIPTVDIGISMLGMHAAREVVSKKDMHLCTTLLEKIMQNHHLFTT